MQALILIDVQNDFLPGGSLAVPEGDQIMPVVNQLIRRYELVVATRDWHPADHASFASQHPGRKPGDVIDLHGLPQVLWPDHCVQHTPGAEFPTSLDAEGIDHVVIKGDNREIDSYSGFFDNGHRKATGLETWLRHRNVDAIVLVGLATDYCVKFTALDARQLGFHVTVVREGTRGVDLTPGDSDRALQEMQAAGAEVVSGIGDG